MRQQVEKKEKPKSFCNFWNENCHTLTHACEVKAENSSNDKLVVYKYQDHVLKIGC